MIDRFIGQYRFLSNFYQCWVRLDGHPIYSSVEHAFQAAKAINPDERVQFSFNKITAGQARRLGRAINIRPDWDQVKLDVMLGLLRQKFQVGLLRDQLIKTHPQELIEGNEWHDHFWGVCKKVGCSRGGENHLGRLLMQVRDELGLRWPAEGDSI